MNKKVLKRETVIDDLKEDHARECKKLTKEIKQLQE